MEQKRIGLPLKSTVRRASARDNALSHTAPQEPVGECLSPAPGQIDRHLAVGDFDCRRHQSQMHSLDPIWMILQRFQKSEKSGSQFSAEFIRCHTHPGFGVAKSRPSSNLMMQ
jgi:hypothetical protein